MSGNFANGATLSATALNSAINSFLVNTQTGTTYTLVAADNGYLVTLNNASAVTITVPNSVFAAGNTVAFLNLGAGTVTLSAGSGATVNGSDLTLTQNQAGSLLFVSASTSVFTKGGGLPKASVSGTTGSPTIDTSTRPGKTIYRFTGSGSITFSTAGACEMLIVGGGGGGGRLTVGGQRGGAGGAGGYQYFARAYVAAQAYTIQIGAGGTGTTGTANNGFISYVQGFAYALPGGGGAGDGGSAGGAGGDVVASGGGGNNYSTTNGAGTGTPGQGTNGVTGTSSQAGGGGGSSATGSGGTGGAGTASSITGASVTYAAGGSAGTAANGSANTGNGGGGPNVNSGSGGSGGSGVVIIVIG